MLLTVAPQPRCCIECAPGALLGRQGRACPESEPGALTSLWVLYCWCLGSTALHSQMSGPNACPCEKLKLRGADAHPTLNSPELRVGTNR